MDYQPALLDALRTLRTRDATHAFKSRAYQTVISQLEQMGPIHSMEDLAGIRGVGDKIRQKIEEVFATGQLRAATAARREVSVLEAFQGIYGVGPVKAAELAPLFRGSTDPIVDLREAITVDPTLLNVKQKIGLRYYEDLLERIPRSEMDAHRDLLGQHFRGAILMGSYRRGLANSGDIDVLLPEGVPLAATVKQMVRAGYLVEVLALGEHKCMGICRLPGVTRCRRLDLLIVPAAEMPFALLYFTGSGPFNVAMRAHALTRGYSMNEHRAVPLAPPSVAPASQAEHGATAVSHPSARASRAEHRAVPLKGHAAAPIMRSEDRATSLPSLPPMRSEEDIFRWLGLAYVPPEERVDGGQIKPL